MTSFAHDTTALAETYDRVSDSQFEGGKGLIERLAVKPSDRVLDVGCGTGRLTRWIAERLGPGGSAVGMDPLVDRIAIARARSAGTAALSFDVGQAEDLSAFPDESFDVVCLSAVFHWVADKPKAMREFRRVLRRGGRMGLTTLPPELHAANTAAVVCREVFSRPPYRDHIDPSKLALQNLVTLTEILAMVLESQLVLVELAVRERSRNHASGNDLVDFIESSSFGNLLAAVSDDLRPSLRTDLAAAFDARKTADGVVAHSYGTMLLARRD
jgi:arsenite methyltransferase